jgi:hypothetical protein
MDFTVRRITRAVAKPFIERLHYSHAVAAGQTAFFGAFLEDGDSLYAVAAYGIGANPLSAATFARLSGLPVTNRNMVELKRICRRGERGTALIPMTAFMSRCHEMLWWHGFGLHTGPGKRFIVSYSDPGQSHDGTLYRAANFRHLGKVPPQRHFKDTYGPRGPQGEVKFVHHRTPHRWMKLSHGVVTTTEVIDLMGLQPFMTVPKDRWLLDLGVPWKITNARYLLGEDCPCPECKTV